MPSRAWLLIAGIVSVAGVFIGGHVAGVVFIERTLSELDRAPIFDELDAGPEATVVFDRQGQPAFTFHIEQRIVVPLNRVSPHLAAAALAAEDRRFYDHRGLDAHRIIASAWRNVRAGGIKEGGSTITQQLVRNLLLTPRRTFARKIREVYLAARLEERYDKRHILETYLNRVYFGQGYYGVEAAARGYYGKSAADLDTAQAALLAGLIKAPSALTPTEHPEAARRRRNHILDAMLELGAVDETAYVQARATPVQVSERSDVLAAEHDATHSGGTEVCGLYFKEEIRRELLRQFGLERLYRGGLRVYSTLDPKLQLAAERALGDRVTALDRGRRRARTAATQAALVAIDARTGDVLALVGGRDFHTSPFNRATQARRQPGSAFKPFIYAAAIERGYSPGSTIEALDTPIAIGTAGRTWLPDDHSDGGTYTLRRALKVSSNRATAQLLQQVGSSSAVEVARRLGIVSQLPAVPSLALGTGEVTLLELTSAYGAFANHGLLASPVLVRRVEDQNGTLLHENTPAVRRAVSDATAFLISSMLADVVNGGTGSRVRGLGFKLPAAGKTGTTQDFTDAWFVGYTPSLVTGVWFGTDNPSTIMARGFAATVAVPAWTEFMKRATRGHPAVWFDPPGDIERHTICLASGQLATPACSAPPPPPPIVDVTWRSVADLPPPVPAPAGVVEEFFVIGTGPTTYCTLHGESPSMELPHAEPQPTPAMEVVPSLPPRQAPPPGAVPSLPPPRPPGD